MEVVRQTSHVDVRGQVEGLGEVDQGEVVLEVQGAEAGMDGDVLGAAVLVGLRLDGLLGVPLAGPDLDALGLQVAIEEGHSDGQFLGPKLLLLSIDILSLEFPYACYCLRHSI